MMDSGSNKPDLGRFGAFARVTPQQAREIEDLGYGAVWYPGVSTADFDWVEPILERTTRLQVATGIVNIWSAPAQLVAESFHRIDKAYPGRFLLGIGVSHPEAVSEYRTPYDVLAEYLDRLDDCGVPAERRVVAALGPRVLKLAGQRSSGAHPYLTTPRHTAQARDLIGSAGFLAPGHKVVPIADANDARAVCRERLKLHLNLKNYINNLRRLGFTDDDIAMPGSERLVDALVAWGTPASIAAQLNEHHEAGADHVAIHLIASSETLVPALAELAGSLR